MSEWLKLELAHHLAPVEAPLSLTWPAPESRRPRLSFTLLPILAAAAALALLILAVPRAGISPAAANRCLARDAGIPLAIPESTPAVIQRARILNQNGARIAAITYGLHHREATVLIARAGTVTGPAWRPHGQAYVIACADPPLACLLCHGT